MCIVRRQLRADAKDSGAIGIEIKASLSACAVCSPSLLSPFHFLHSGFISFHVYVFTSPLPFCLLLTLSLSFSTFVFLPFFLSSISVSQICFLSPKLLLFHHLSFFFYLYMQLGLSCFSFYPPSPIKEQFLIIVYSCFFPPLFLPCLPPPVTHTYTCPSVSNGTCFHPCRKFSSGMVWPTPSLPT